MKKLDLSISIVSYNTKDLLCACLSSLRKLRDEVTFETIVVDNNSSDGSVDMVRDEFPEVLLIELNENLGYGRANNRGLEKAGGRYFFILNSDTEVQAGALRTLVDFLDENPEAGAVTAQLILPDNSIQPSCATDPNLLKVFWEQTYLDKLFPNNKVTGGYSITHWDYNSVREVEQVAGAAVMIRREAWEQVKGFDPAFFMYFEDTDLCIRLRKAGWSIWFTPNAKVHHKVGASSDKDWQTRARMISSLNWSRYYYFSNRESAFRGKIFKVIVIFGATLRLIAWSIITLLKPDKRDQVKIFRSVLRNTWKMQAERWDG